MKMWSVAFLCVAVLTLKNTVHAQAESRVIDKCSTDPEGYCTYDAFSYNCSYSTCTGIPLDIPANAQEIHLTGNKIQRVDTTLVDYMDLDILDLSDNIISAIDEGALSSNIRILNLTSNDITMETVSKAFSFKNLNKLEYLYLADNKIQNLTIAETFYQLLPQLKHLDFRANQIEYLAHNVLSDFRNLETMDLSRNHLSGLDSSDLLGLDHLTLLNMSNNRIEFIPDGMFRGMKAVKTVDFSDNHIGHVSQQSFEEAGSLETLHLEINRIRTLPAAMCFHLKNLRSIYLDKNPLETIEYGSLPPFLKEISIQECDSLKVIADVIQSQAELKTVIISHNKHLASISEHAFGRGSKVDHIDLSYNALTTLPEHLLLWSNVTTANLAGNAWDCDCHMSWIQTLPTSSPVLESLVCYNPLHLRGRFASSLESKDFSCSIVSKYRSHAAIAVAILFTAVIVCLVALIGHRFRYRICPSWYPVGKYETLYSSCDASADDDSCHPVTIKKYANEEEPVAV